jgi:hypothetical protein
MALFFSVAMLLSAVRVHTFQAELNQNAGRRVLVLVLVA